MGENFREFRELQAIGENIIHECLVFVDKDRAIVLIRKKNYSRNALSCTFAKVFSRENFPLYGMEVWSHCTIKTFITIESKKY